MGMVDHAHLALFSACLSLNPEEVARIDKIGRTGGPGETHGVLGMIFILHISTGVNTGDLFRVVFRPNQNPAGLAGVISLGLRPNLLQIVSRDRDAHRLVPKRGAEVFVSPVRENGHDRSLPDLVEEFKNSQEGGP